MEDIQTGRGKLPNSNGFVGYDTTILVRVRLFVISTIANSKGTAKWYTLFLITTIPSSDTNKMQAMSPRFVKHLYLRE